MAYYDDVTGYVICDVIDTQSSVIISLMIESVTSPYNPRGGGGGGGKGGLTLKALNYFCISYGNQKGFFNLKS